MSIARSFERAEAGLGGCEDAGHRVVVPLGDRVELVVVASGAGDGGGEQSLGDRIDLFVDDVEPELGLALLVVSLGPDREVAGRDEIPCGVVLGLGVEEITGELAGDEAVVRDVVVEGLDHPVAISPRMGIGDVVLLAARFRVAGDVEPVATPAFTECGGRQQAVDHPLPREWRLIGLEGLDLLGGGRKSDEIEGDAAEPGRRGRGSDWSETAAIEVREHESVDFVQRPVRVRDFRKRGPLHRPIGPVVPAGFDVVLGPAVFIAGIDVHDGCRRHRRASEHPLLEQGDLIIGEPSARGHLESGIVVADRLDQEARIGVTGNDRRSGVAADEQLGVGVESEACANSTSLIAVAVEASTEQQGADLRFEEVEVLPVEGPGRLAAAHGHRIAFHHHRIVIRRHRCLSEQGTGDRGRGEQPGDERARISDGSAMEGHGQGDVAPEGERIEAVDDCSEGPIRSCCRSIGSAIRW